MGKPVAAWEIGGWLHKDQTILRSPFCALLPDSCQIAADRDAELSVAHRLPRRALAGTLMKRAVLLSKHGLVGGAVA